MKDQIAAEAYSNPSYLEAVRRINYPLSDDLFHETLLNIISKSDDDLKKIKDSRQNGMLFYFIASAYRANASRYSPFNKKYKSQPTKEIISDYYSTVTEPYNVQYEYKINRTEKIVNQCIEAPKSQDEFYQAKLFEMWMELGSYRAVSKEIGIPTMAVYEGVRKFKQHIKKLVK